LPDYPSVQALLDAMCADKGIVRAPSAIDPSFGPIADARWQDVRDAHRQIEPMFWGPRVSIEACCERIRGWLGQMSLPGT